MGELARPSVVAEILERHGLRLSRSLGQHFLVDGNVLRRIVQAASLSPHESVLEVGPGIGTLTEELLARAGRVVAVEMDSRLLRILEENLRGAGNLELVQGDALRIDLSALFAAGEKVKVVSNLPYSIATPLILRLLLELPQAESMVLTVQRELADRYLAEPGDPSYGGVSVKMRLLAEVRRLSSVPPTVFFPPPQVDSALMFIRRREKLLPGMEALPFFRFIDAAFASRRKMLVNALGGGRSPYCSRPAVEATLRSRGLPPSARAEELTCEELVAVYLALPPR